MPKVTFSGFIVPDRFLKQAGRGPLLLPDPALSGATVTYAIVDSKVVAECEVGSTDSDSLNRLHMWAYHLIRDSVDVVSFAYGIGLTVILGNCTLPDGVTLPIHSWDRSVKDLCTPSTDDILRITEKERSILKHIHDLASTLVHPLETTVNCGRAIDGVCRLISSDANPKKRWVALRDNLNLTRP